MGKRNIIVIALLLICCFSSAVPVLFAGNVKVEALLSPKKFSVNEGARLRIVVEGVRKNAEFEIPDIANLKFHQRGQSSQTSYINGKMSSSITYNFIVQALAAGKYTIPSIMVNAGGEQIRTGKISFEVTGGAAGSGSGGKEGKSIKEIAFITVSETADHYPGEIVPITLKAYFSRNYRVDLNSLPTLIGDGVVMPQLSSEPEQGQEAFGGEPFHVLTWNTSLSGIKTGKHKLQFTLDASVLIPQQRRSRSPFSNFGGSMFDDSLFDSFFGNVERKPITAVSPELEFNVLPLPTEGKPVGFTGAIGKFTMDIGANPRRVEVGEPMTLSMTIGGEGNFNRVEAPVFPASSSWRTYSPTSDYVEDADDFRRTKSFEQAIVVKDPAVKEIPALNFSYFDPDKKEYVTLQSGPIPIELINTGGQQVQAAARPSAVPQVSKSQTPVGEQVSGQNGSSVSAPLFQNLSPVQLKPGRFYAEIKPLYQRGWFLTLAVLLALLFFVLLYLNWRRHLREKQPMLLLEMKRESQLQRDLAAVEEARSIGDSTLFLERSRKAIQNRMVGTSSVQSASAMSVSDLKAGVGEDSPLVRIFSMAEEAAYGGAFLSSEEMNDYFTELKTELEKS